MNVLWITNILFPDICNKLEINSPVTGGWMKSSAQAILDLNHDITLAVATLYGNKFRKDVINGVVYYCLPFNIYDTEYNSSIEIEWEKVANDFHPDIVHIHGTEFPHGLAYIKGVGVNNVVVSIQGLVGAYARYSLGQIPESKLKKYWTIYDVLKGHLLHLPNQMRKQGELENEYIRLAHHVIGRTDWDKDHVWAINPNVNYHFCNETLREPFYNTEWSLEGCIKHSIFLSQAHKPIKGIHKIIEALPYVIREYPDVKVYVAGANFLQRRTFRDKLKYSMYANYVTHLMKKLNVIDRFEFLGLLNENEMSQAYRKAHVFVCPSSIENSPNSLGEAQLVGTPVIASYVGGVSNMLEHERTGLLYRFDEHEMLASCICRIFKDNELAQFLSDNGKIEANRRHNRVLNAQRTIDIYNEIDK